MKKVIRWLHHFTIPSHKNNFRAKALHLDTLVILIGVVSVYSLLTFWTRNPSVLGFARDIRIEELYAKTNELRTSQGLPPLKYNNQLALAAQNKAAHMFQHDYWAHFGGGATPWDFIVGAGYSYEVAGENLAKNFMFSDSVVEGWKNSPTHYANIVRPEYDEVGFAVMNGTLQGEETTLVVQMFGKRLTQIPEPVQDSEANQFAQAGGDSEIGTQNGNGSSVEGTSVESSGTSSEIPAEATAHPTDEQLAQVQKPVVASSFISLDRMEFDWTVIIMGVLILVLAVDLYYAHKLELVRISGKNIAHIAFLVAIIIGLMIIKSGIIL